MSKDSKITLREDGPLLVHSPPAIKDHKGNAMEAAETAALCRCGASKTKPFCDGTHRHTGFSSAPDHSKIRNAEIKYTGTIGDQEVTVHYTPVLCSHAGECARRAGKVFHPASKPWITPEEGSLEDIMDVITACPSGALRVSTARVEAAHMTTPEESIVVERHGPYRVANVTLDAEFNGVGACRSKYVLCRCGLSKNKPFCDGTHYEEKWRDDA